MDKTCLNSGVGIRGEVVQQHDPLVETERQRENVIVIIYLYGGMANNPQFAIRAPLDLDSNANNSLSVLLLLPVPLTSPSAVEVKER